VNGISFNINTGAIKFLFQTAKSNDQALFDAYDVHEVLTKGITSSIFTLDQPAAEFQSHPFQEMRYAPDNLSKTNFLMRLLHADYLLKMISTGIEVCAKAPFQTRAASEGFMMRLPEWLRQELRPVHERKDGAARNSVHRFWIEAGEIPYECCFNEYNNTVTYYVSDVPMCVKKQLMKYDEQGNLIDDVSKINDDHSPEGEFAQAFTRNYDEIGSYFPELLRLKELLKLGVLLVFIRSTYNNVQKYINTISIETEPIRDLLQSIRLQLPATNERNLTEITDAICLLCHSPDPRTSVKAMVSDWLLYNRAQPLIDFMADSLYNYKRNQYSQVLETIVGMKVKLDNETQAKLNSTKAECSWVPAVFSSKENSHLKVYGGVNLSIRLKEGQARSGCQQGTTVNASEITKNIYSQQTTSNRNTDHTERTAYQFVVDRCENKPLGRGTTGRFEPQTLNEQLALNAAMAGAHKGKELTRIAMRDSRWPMEEGWIKMSSTHEGTGIDVHYVFNKNTEEIDDFKFKDYKKEK
ncbi:unnamed protein product, partial [Rotaria sp. Silwood2]